MQLHPRRQVGLMGCGQLFRSNGVHGLNLLRTSHVLSTTLRSGSHLISKPCSDARVSSACKQALVSRSVLSSVFRVSLNSSISVFMVQIGKGRQPLTGRTRWGAPASSRIAAGWRPSFSAFTVSILSCHPSKARSLSRQAWRERSPGYWRASRSMVFRVILKAICASVSGFMPKLVQERLRGIRILPHPSKPVLEAFREPGEGF